MLQITGFSKLQMAIADDLWNLETVSDVEQYILSLPKRLQPHARVVLDMMVAASLDLDEVDTEFAAALINRIKEDSRKS